MEDRRMLATITVNTLLDVDNASDGLTTLREAIAAAAPSGDVIAFSVTGTINLTATDHSGQLVIDKAITINGPGANLLTINAFDPTLDSGDGNRVFDIIDPSSGTTPQLVEISHLTITGGDINFLSEDGPQGGAIRSTALLALTSCTITGNSADRGGGIFVQVAGGSPTTSRDVLTIEDCLIQGNEAIVSGGVEVDTNNFIEPTDDVIAIRRTRILDNKASFDAAGVKVNLRGAHLTIEDSEIATSNGNVGFGRGILATLSEEATMTLLESRVTGNQGPEGAGIHATVLSQSKVTINASIVADNAAEGNGGGISAGCLLQKSSTRQELRLLRARSTRATSVEAGVPSASPSRKSVSNVGDIKLCSSRLMYVRSTSASKASRSCVIPASWRAILSTSPNMPGYCLAQAA